MAAQTTAEQAAVQQAIVDKILAASISPSEWHVKVGCEIGAGYLSALAAGALWPDFKYISAVQNSALACWFALHAPNGACSKATNIEDMTIPKIDAEAQRPFIALVDEILTAKAADPQADTSELEEEIDRLVYRLYGLNAYEVAEVGGYSLDDDFVEDYGMTILMEEVADEETLGFEEVEKILREWDEDRD